MVCYKGSGAQWDENDRKGCETSNLISNKVNNKRYTNRISSTYFPSQNWADKTPSGSQGKSESPGSCQNILRS